MSQSLRIGSAVLATLVIAVAAPGGAAAAPRLQLTPEGHWIRPADGCGTHQVNRAGTVQQHQRAAGSQRTVYLNRNGGTYQIGGGGATNAGTNVASSSVSADGRGRTAVIPPLAAGFNWSAIAACVRVHYDKYNIRVVETEPTSGDYVEAVVGGFGTELGFGSDELFGIASADNFCGVTERGIAFNFSETHRQVPRKDDELCATIAHEVGHLLALEHETLATDVMSYVLIADSSTKAFIDQNVACGVQPGQNQPCSCGTAQTNSHARLAQFVGTRPTETVAPTITLVSPGDDDRLSPAFTVVATAADDQAMEGVALLLDGFEIGNDYEAVGDRYEIAVTDIAEGEHTLAVEARDQAGNVAMVQISVIVAKLPAGEVCVSSAECAGAVCATSADGNFCTQTCDVASDSCPSDFACSEVAVGPALCVPDEDAGGCCSTGGGHPASTALLVVGLGLLLVRRRRRAA